ncbi:MAG: molybdopterin biosynthesis protein [Candidatus Methanoperedens sp.]|nr:molybdopterin biosynthesis protein [Candidatus Methanoperedens sp.]MCE8425277.1 molybdopterin biosynthesis protein [Candidatus Methanoperedens sp.]MCE8427798.1 molybdopterin biosynthesis protein [Candidatus Methanoperedens sp.]
MMQKEYRKLVTMEYAKKIIENLGICPRIIELDIDNVLSCVLAEDVYSEIDVPPFDRASMDGYAVIASDTYTVREDKPVHLKIIASIHPGANPDIRLQKGDAVQISTGAVMPSSADAVVMVEYTNTKKNIVLISRPVSINENVMHAGSDIMIGERILRKGSQLGVKETGVLAACGKKTVRVAGLKIAVISTGNELCEPGEQLEAGKIYDVNSFSIASGVKECGGIPARYEIAKDDPEKIRKIIKKAANECDIILTSGSTSAGSGDIMYRIIEENGTILVHGIDIKPGKPAIIGKIFEKPVFGLPGYPASALTIFDEFIAPEIRKITGRKKVMTQLKAKMAVRVRSEGRRQLLPVGLVRGVAYPIEKGSGAITTLMEADGFIEVPANVELLEAGDCVDVTLFDMLEAPDLLFVGSHCPGLDVLSDIMDLKMRVINVGSSGGLNAIRNGFADIAGVHLLSESGEYNIPFLKKFGIKDAVLIKGYLREQGLIIRPESNIKTFEDIINARIMNRNTGSGTRVMTDLKLKDLAAKKGISFEVLTNRIQGYHTEAKTHSAVASAVKLGKVDAGIGVRAVAELNGLKFIKIADEEYDFVIPIRLIESKEIRSFLDALRSSEFKENIPSGLRTYERTGEIKAIK